jgi:hypothetical protein
MVSPSRTAAIAAATRGRNVADGELRVAPENRPS